MKTMYEEVMGKLNANSEGMFNLADIYILDFNNLETFVKEGKLLSYLTSYMELYSIDNPYRAVIDLIIYDLMYGNLKKNLERFNILSGFSKVKVYESYSRYKLNFSLKYINDSNYMNCPVCGKSMIQYSAGSKCSSCGYRLSVTTLEAIIAASYVEEQGLSDYIKSKIPNSEDWHSLYNQELEATGQKKNKFDTQYHRLCLKLINYISKNEANHLFLWNNETTEMKRVLKDNEGTIYDWDLIKDNPEEAYEIAKKCQNEDGEVMIYYQLKENKASHPRTKEYLKEYIDKKLESLRFSLDSFNRLCLEKEQTK